MKNKSGTHLVGLSEREREWDLMIEEVKKVLKAVVPVVSYRHCFIDVQSLFKPFISVPHTSCFVLADLNMLYA